MQRRSLSLALSVLIGFAGALVGAPVAQAAPVTTATWQYFRDGDLATGSVDLLQGENGYASFSATIGPDWSGWAFPKKKKFVFTTSDFMVVDAAHPDEPLYSGWVFWQGTSSTDPDCIDGDYFTTKFVVSQRSCIDTVSFAYEMVVDTSETDVTLESGLLEATFTGNKRPATTEDGLSYDVYAAVQVEDASSLEIDTAQIGDITVETTMCIDESLIDNGDEATREFAVKFDGTPIRETTSNSDSWVDWQWTPENQSVLLEGDEPLENLTDQAGGWVTTADEGVVTVTVSSDLTIGGSSILEPCAQDYAGSLDTSNTGDTPAASDSMMTLPSAFAWRDGSTPGMFTDEFGGVFAVDVVFDDTNGTESTQITHLGSSGDNDDFAGDGVVDLDLNGNSFDDIARWGAGGSHWAASSYVDFDFSSLEVVTGSMTSSATSTSTIDIATLERYCNRPGAWIANVDLISAPMESPLLQINCGYRASKKNPSVPVTALAMVDMTQDDTLIGVGGFPSPSLIGGGVAVLDISIDPNATGRDTAVFVYSQSTKVKKRGTEIRLNSIEPDGTTNFVSLATNPFGKKEINSLALVPGATEGTWLGYVDQSYSTKNTYVINQHLVRVTAGDYVTIGEPVTMGYDGEADYWEDVIVSLGSNDEFGQISFARSMFDNEAIGTVDLNIWDAVTGDSTSGESIATIDPTHGYEPLVWSSPGAGDPTFYWITSESEYQVVTWNIP